MCSLPFVMGGALGLKVAALVELMRRLRFHSLPFQEFLDSRQSLSCYFGARVDGFFCAIEFVPGDGLHVGPQNKVGVTLPDFQLMFLGSTNGTSHHLKDV